MRAGGGGLRGGAHCGTDRFTERSRPEGDSARWDTVSIALDPRSRNERQSHTGISARKLDRICRRQRCHPMTLPIWKSDCACKYVMKMIPSTCISKRCELLAVSYENCGLLIVHAILAIVDVYNITLDAQQTSVERRPSENARRLGIL